MPLNVVAVFIVCMNKEFIPSSFIFLKIIVRFFKIIYCCFIFSFLSLGPDALRLPSD